MEEKEVILTQEGYDNLDKELNYLKTEKRTEIAERIKVALGFGDLSENSECRLTRAEKHGIVSLAFGRASQMWGNSRVAKGGRL